MQQYVKHSDLPTRNDPNYVRLWKAKRRKPKAERYEGKPCKNCGSTTRYKSTRDCVQCLLRRRLTYDMPRQYGITLEEYNVILSAQNGACAICKTRMTTPCVDHDHNTGRVRGLLCSECNKAIGFLKDDPDRCLNAATYLRSFR
jgi:Recombination endonuclease VII